MNIENFIRIYQVDNIICDQLIDYHKKNSEYKQKGCVNKSSGIEIDENIKKSIDVYFYNPSKDKSILALFDVLSQAVYEYMKYYNLNQTLKTDTANNIQYYPPGGGFKVWHHERDNRLVSNRQLVYMLYLNDVPEGGTEFKYQNLKIDAKKGKLVIWPSDFTHTHRGIISETHEKYIATGWFVLN